MESYWLKLSRAQEHFLNLERLVSEYRKTKPYAISHTMQTNRKRRTEHFYRLNVTAEPDPWLCVVLGDLLFDVRSALDHLAVALAGNRRKGKAEFPIWKSDPLALKPSGEPVNEDARDAWLTKTKGIPPDALAIIKRLQPHERGPDSAKHHPLAVLSALQNADKHRNLLVAFGGLANVKRVTGPERRLNLEWIVNNPIHDGALILRSPDEVDVEVTGTAFVTFGGSTEGQYVFPDQFRSIMGFVVKRVVEPLEGFIR